MSHKLKAAGLMLKSKNNYTVGFRDLKILNHPYYDVLKLEMDYYYATKSTVLSISETNNSPPIKFKMKIHALVFQTGNLYISTLLNQLKTLQSNML